MTTTNSQMTHIIDQMMDNDEQEEEEVEQVENMSPDLDDVDDDLDDEEEATSPQTSNGLDHHFVVNPMRTSPPSSSSSPRTTPTKSTLKIVASSPVDALQSPMTDLLWNSNKKHLVHSLAKSKHQYHHLRDKIFEVRAATSIQKKLEFDDTAEELSLSPQQEDDAIIHDLNLHKQEQL